MSAAIDGKAVSKAISAVIEERCTQHAKWGEQRHSWPEWIAILTEEVGEAATLANWIRWPESSGNAQMTITEWHRGLRTELVQVSAVAVQIIEHIDAELAK